MIKPETILVRKDENDFLVSCICLSDSSVLFEELEGRGASLSEALYDLAEQFEGMGE
jgi:hypothetical protein